MILHQAGAETLDSEATTVLSYLMRFSSSMLRALVFCCTS